MFEDRWIYFPVRWPRGPWQDVGGDAYADEWITTEDGQRLHAWRAEHGEARSWLLYLHGNAGNLAYRAAFVERLRALPANVLALDYRGYGRSSGRPSEAGLYRDADAAWRHLVEQCGVPPGRVVAFGKSLGAAVAVELATRRQLGGLILQSTFTDGWDMACIKTRLPRWLVRRISRNQFDSRTRIATIRCPKLIVHGSGDHMVPIAMGRALYDAAAEPKAFLDLGPLDHDGFLRAGAAWDCAVRAILEGAGD